ncbi:hypothetical protein FXN61_27770 [Lentzea sp. PSKA42]|uniref:Surface-anchored protein n=1 Tax=Lentzea indica TaxID=2604800 RepID=A0ABX1FP04_9PSEU|nr:hypothetical protein [Lentzea indica]
MGVRHRGNAHRPAGCRGIPARRHTGASAVAPDGGSPSRATTTSVANGSRGTARGSRSAGTSGRAAGTRGRRRGTASRGQRKVTVERGHVDALAPRLVDGGLRVHVKDGSVVGTVTWREPADVEFKVTNAARVALPDAAALSFLGAAGGQIHLLPQQEQPGILWIGWSTEELKPADITGPVTWTLTSVTGPGPFGLFTTGSFGAHSVIFNSTDGLPDTHSVALGTHAHANWAFGKPGRYRLDFTVSATKTDGSTVSDKESYTFLVGDTTATTTPDNNTTRDGRRNTALASTGPVGSPAAATALALALIVTGTAVMVLTRRRTAKETS